MSTAKATVTTVGTPNPEALWRLWERVLEFEAEQKQEDVKEKELPCQA